MLINGGSINGKLYKHRQICTSLVFISFTLLTFAFHTRYLSLLFLSLEIKKRRVDSSHPNASLFSPFITKERKKNHVHHD